MNAHATFAPDLSLSPVKDLVGSLTESAASALSGLDARDGAQAKKSLQIVRASARLPQAQKLTPWMEIPAPPKTRISNVVLFGLVVLGHAAAIYLLTQVQTRAITVEPQALQVALMAQMATEVEKPLPPPVQLQQVTFALPVEPVLLDIAESETAITVAARPVEAVTNATAATPKVVSSVEYLREPQPKYPPAARALKQRGTVTLRVLVDAEGHAREVNLHRSSGYRVLDDAARKAVLEAQFKPYMENGHALAVYVFVPIEFGAV